MENPRPEKVAVVDEVRERFTSSSAALLTEYRGLDVSALGELRRALREAGGEYKVYKNTLVRFAARDAGPRDRGAAHRPDGHRLRGRAPRRCARRRRAVAKALRDFARTNPALVVKGGVLDDRSLSRRRRQGPGRRRAPRGAAGQAGRWARCPDAAVRRAAPGPAAQLRLRPVGTHREGRRGLMPLPLLPTPTRHPPMLRPTRPSPPRKRAEEWQPRKRSSTRSRA